MSVWLTLLVRSLWVLGTFTCGFNALVAITQNDDVEACAFALVGILLVLSAGVIAHLPQIERRIE